MNLRIKEIRKNANVNQDTFAEKIGLTKNFVSLIETGGRVPSDRTIKDICRIFSVNEEWLRNGTGEMYLPKTKEQELGDFIGDVMADLDESFRKRLVLALSKLTPEQWDLLEQIVDNVKKQE